MMGIVFRLWTMGIQAGVLICIVLAVRAYLKKYPKIFSCCLWIPVGLRLLCPLWIESPFGQLPGAFAEGGQKEMAATQTMADEMAQSDGLLENTVQAKATAKEELMQAPQDEAGADQGQAKKQAGGNMENGPIRKIWTAFADLVRGRVVFRKAERYRIPVFFYAAVCIWLMACYLIRYVWFRRRLSDAVWSHGRIWLNEEICSPFVMGVFSPKIYLPYEALNDAYILEHEQTHIRHHDPLICMAGAACICLHWWNPLVWLAVLKMREDMEMFCDETVLLSASPSERKEYANALLSYAVKENGFGKGLAFGESHTERRIQNIRYHKTKKNRWVSFSAVFLVTVCAAAFFMTPAQAKSSQGSRRQAQQGHAKKSESKQINEQENEQMQAQTSPFAYADYSGYMDACTQWAGYTAFVGQDYDGDGLTDRVLRTYEKDSQCCRYQILFGNQAVLNFEKEVYTNGTPTIKSADLNGDGEKEIILLLQYEMSTDMRAFGDLAVFEKQGNTYVQAALPFGESEQGYSMHVPLRYEKIREQMIAVSLDGAEGLAEDPIKVPISNWLWEDAQYKDLFIEGRADSVIWDIFLMKDGQKEKLACKVHLFDKWSDYGLILVLGYADGRYVIEQVLPALDEFSDTIPDTKRTWKLREYRLSAKELKLADGKPVTLELWLKEGTYITGEDVAPSVGSYEENYQGEYMLVTKDRKGNVLDEHDLNHKSENSAEHIFGTRTNFSGPFDIVQTDYNGDGCPDFTIGVELSSSMSFFVLYTVDEKGRIKSICEDAIPSLEKEHSILLEQREADGALISYGFDNWIGESRKMVYQWDAGKNAYTERRSQYF